MLQPLARKNEFSVFSLTFQVLIFVSACAAIDMSKIRRVANHIATRNGMFVCYVNHPGLGKIKSAVGKTRTCVSYASASKTTGAADARKYTGGIMDGTSYFSGGSFIFSKEGNLICHAGLSLEILQHRMCF